LHRLILRDLNRRLKVLQCFKENPEILEVEIPPIIFITGHPRSGTTLLHQLMATHPLGRPLLRWELVDPLPPPESKTYDTDPRIAKLQASIEPLRGSLLEKLHWVNADEPEENTWGFLDCTGLLGCGIMPRMPTWSKWMAENDPSPTFQEFRKVIQLLIWKCPPPTGGHLVLKCVMKTMHIQAFADVFSEANIVITHRDPYRTLVSSCISGNTICQPFSEDRRGPVYNDGDSDQDMLKREKLVLQALMDFAKAEPKRAKHILYPDLMEDAVLTTRSVYEYFDMEIPENFEKGIVDFLTEQRKGKRAAPPKKYDTFGYDADKVWADPIVKEYCDYFGVKSETTRLTDTRTGMN
jgi:hypothetical protein